MKISVKSALLGAVCAIAVASAAQAQPRAIDVPAGDMKDALDSYIQQSGVQLIYRVADVRGVSSAGAHGRLSPNEAMGQLLQGTKLVAHEDSSGAMLVASATQPAEPPAAASPMPSDQFETVVVSAQRRDQNLADIPLSVSTFNSDLASKVGVTTTNDIQALVPGLQMTMVNNSVATFIRGIGSANTTGAESAVALYVDGVYYPNLAGDTFSLSNVKRVEVLKGPQGTLFGRNATAGVIQIITKKPSHVASADLSLGYANYNTADLNFYGTTGITDDLAADLAVHIRNQADGWGKNITTGKDVLKTDEISVRSKWLWTPDAKTDVTLSLSYDKVKSDVGTANHLIPPSLAVDGGPYPGFYNIRADQPVYGHSSMETVSVNLHHDFDWAQLVSISAYQRFHTHIVFDQDMSPLPFVLVDGTQHNQLMSQELQLLSEAGSKIQWIAGAYYLNWTNNYSPTKVSGLALPTPRYLSSKILTQSEAVFGQATAEIFDGTHLTVGLRYTLDQIRLNSRVRAPALYVFPRRVADASKLTWRFALDHKFDDGTLIYASYNRGFRSGAWSPAAPANPAVKPEVLDAYEAGLKHEFFGGAVLFDMSAFYYKYNNVQVVATVVGGNYLYNAAKATSKGIEISFSGQPIEHLDVHASASFLDTKYDSFANAVFYTALPTGGAAPYTGDATGHHLPFAPPVSLDIGAVYTIPTASGVFDIAGNFSHTNSFYFDAQNTKALSQPAVNLLSLSLGWVSPDGDWETKLWGKNLLDEKYYSRANATTLGFMGSAAEPLTYGITLTRHFN